MVKKILIIGGGPAGNSAALAAAECCAGPIMIVERDAYGGTCTNRGCIPTKFLLSRSEGLASGTGGNAVGSGWGKLIGHKTALVGGLAKSIETRLVSRGIECVRGAARFVGANEVEVASPDGATARFEAERIIVATGATPAELPGAPRDGRLVINSTDALDLREIPSSLVVIGSGAVGAEFAFIFSRLGTAVTIVEAAERLFPAEDQAVGELFNKIYGKMGVRVIIGDGVAGIDKGGDGVAVLLQSGAVIQAEKALVGVGRELATRGLGCEAAGIDLGPRGRLIVDDELRTSQPHIRAAGDVTGKMLLAHAAAYMGEFAARRSFGEAFAPVPYHSIPWATFTKPEVAGVGMTFESSSRAGLDCSAATVQLMDSVKARIDRTTDGFIKVVYERQGGRIVGGTVVGPHASDLIHVLALAVHKGMTVGEMRGFTFVHPSIAELYGDLYSTIQ